MHLAMTFDLSIVIVLCTCPICRPGVHENSKFEFKNKMADIKKYFATCLPDKAMDESFSWHHAKSRA